MTADACAGPCLLWRLHVYLNTTNVLVLFYKILCIMNIFLIQSTSFENKILNGNLMFYFMNTSNLFNRSQLRLFLTSCYFD